MQLKNILILCIMSLFSVSLSAQKTFNIRGVVNDGKEPLVGVSVFLKGLASVGTTTDSDGKFSIKASKGDIISFTYLGYENYEYLVEKEDNNVTIKMTESNTQIDEVVVTALSKQRKISVVGAIASVDVKEIQTPATSIANMLGGRVPGIITMQASGEPGKNIAEFWVRGIGTFGANSSALVLIDGLEGDLNSVDPADVESFSILKDASATAVYGVRGANGVVLVTTKRGQSGKLKITVRANYTLSYLNRMPEYVGAYDYASLANEARSVRGNTPLYSDLEMNLIRYHLDNDLYPDVNWQDEIMKRNGFQQTYYMSGQGGSDIARYFMSLGVSNEDAAYKVAPNNPNKSGVGYNTYNYRINLDINLTKTTTLYFGTNGYLTLTKQPGSDTDGNADTDKLWTAQSLLTPLTVPLMYSTGQLPAYGGGGSLISPYVLLNYTGTQSKQTYAGEATLAVEQDLSMFLKGLKLKIQGAYDNNSWFNETRYVLPEMYRATGRDVNGNLLLVRSVNAVAAKYYNDQGQYRKYHLEGTLTWDKLIKASHRVSFLGYYYMSDEKDTKDIYNSGIDPSMAAIPKRYQGLSSRITYGFKDTYLLDFNFGYTGSENFEPGKQFGFFPSIAGGWVPTNYQWVKEHLKWLDFLKFRASYGSVGNDRIANFRFPYLTLVSVSDFGGGGGWSYAGSTVNESQFGADNLLWEKALKADAGIEGRLFKERLSFVVDFFNDQRKGIFQRRESIPAYVGLPYSARPYGNVGEMRSFGSDGNIAYSQKINKDWEFTLRGNFTYSQNKVLNWEQPPQKYPYQSYNGYPTDRIYGYIAMGLFKDANDIVSSPVQTFGGSKVMPGDIKYRDINGDGVINSDDMVPLSDPTYPRLMYGFGGELKYKNFTLGVLFKGTGKTPFYYVGYTDPNHSEYGINGPGYIPFYNGETGNVLAIVNNPANRWIPMDYALSHGIDPALAENPNARFPRLDFNYNANNSQLSTFWKGDSRYLRLQEITLNYHIAPNFLRKVGLSSADIQLVADDIYVWDKVGMWDPEQAARDGGVYPIPARYTLQLYLNF